MAKRRHLLLTVLGTAPKPACYVLGDRRSEARLAPVALMELLSPDDRPDCVLALCTAQAMHDSWPLLEQALGAGCSTAAVEVPAGDTQADVDSYLSKVTTAITGNVDLTVDVTHGYRHFSFLTYVAVLYLAALRRVSVRGAYYGLLRPGPDPSGVNQARSEASSSSSEGAAARNVTEATFLDLRPLLALPRWLHALQVLDDTGSTTPMAEVLCDGSRNQSAGRIARELSRISEGYLSGLPVELGRETHLFRQRSLRDLKKLLRREHHLPLAGELVDRLGELLEPFALPQAPGGDGWKRQVVLSKDELKRQARVIDDLWRHGTVGTALGLMNEWTTSWAVWRIGDGDGWIERQVRRKASHRLHAIAAVGRDSGIAGVLTSEQRALGSFWEELCELRNAYHHHGMRPGVVVSEGGKVRKQLDKIRDFWRTLRSCPDMSLSLGESHGGPVLVSPIGMRPGVLFSALHACRAAGDGADPTVCLVVCSSETEGLIAEAVSHAEYSGPVEPLRLEDPYGGRPEIDRVVKAARARFVGAGEVFVNVTGGTTLMGLVAEAFAVAARRLACPVRRFGLIDRRPPAQQDAEPYRAGEPFWLDSAKDDDDD